MSKKNIKQIKGGVIHILLTVFLALFIFILVITGILFINSPGKPAPFLNENKQPLKGSISEKVFVNIGGAKQGMFIQGKNTDNPVLLFVHGGPCFPEYFLAQKYPSGIEDHFTVCYWEERGSGLSYSKDVTMDSMTMEQLTSDTIEVTNYLRDRFGKEKIYLMAHSGGTIPAIKAVVEKPELYNSYIGISQISRQKESEKIAYQYMLDEYQKLGNTKKVKALKEYPILESDSSALLFFKSPLREQTMHELGIGTMRNMHSVPKGLFIPVLQCKAYTLKEKINFWVSKVAFINRTNLKDQVLGEDLALTVQSLKVPVYFFSGLYDLTTNYYLSKKHLNQLEAPLKGFYTFHQSAHSPIFEEPEKFHLILEKDVLKGSICLADTE